MRYHGFSEEFDQIITISNIRLLFKFSINNWLWFKLLLLDFGVLFRAVLHIDYN
jgi:hypothetical protein